MKLSGNEKQCLVNALTYAISATQHSPPLDAPYRNLRKKFENALRTEAT